MNQHFTVNSISAAWQKVNEVFPSDYSRDDQGSKNAGYDIYRSTVQTEGDDWQWHYCYICDLGNCLEVNLTDHKWNNTTIYINIEKAVETVEAAPKTEKPEVETSILALTEEEALMIRSVICRKSMQNTMKCIETRCENNDFMFNFYDAQQKIYHSLINRLDLILGYEESFPNE